VRADLEADLQADPESVARAICLRMLTGAPRSRAQLAEALHRRAVPDEVAARVLDRFTEVGLVDDAGFAASYVASRHVGRGLARRALLAELQAKGIGVETATAAVEPIDAEAEERRARELVERRLAAVSRLSREAKIRRLAGMLARKGYPAGLAFRVVTAALAAAAQAQGAEAEEPAAPGW
jgi:regulatory protein